MRVSVPPLMLRMVSKNIWSRDKKQSHWALQISKATVAGNHEQLASDKIHGLAVENEVSRT